MPVKLPSLIKETGPLMVAACLGKVGVKDPGAQTIILIGSALNAGPSKLGPDYRHVRMEMSLEDATDLARSIMLMVASAKKG